MVYLTDSVRCLSGMTYRKRQRERKSSHVLGCTEQSISTKEYGLRGT